VTAQLSSHSLEKFLKTLFIVSDALIVEEEYVGSYDNPGYAPTWLYVINIGIPGNPLHVLSF
jgi:isoleucyl-tRNA synthetase